MQENEHVYENIDEKDANPSNNNNSNISEENTDYDKPKIPPQSKDARKADSHHETQSDQHTLLITSQQTLSEDYQRLVHKLPSSST